MSTVAPPTVNEVRGTRARFGVVAFIFALAAVTYLDRACIGKMAPSIQRDFSFDDKQMGWVFTSFAIAYAAFELPTAWWAVRRGTRRVLTRIVLWWSVFTMLTACVLTPGMVSKVMPHAGSATAWLFSFWMMLGVRFLFGIGEAGAWPCAAASFAKWMPARERGFAQGMLFAGAHISGGLTPLLVVWLQEQCHWEWRWIFLVFGTVGLSWAAAWYAWFRDEPSEHRSVNGTELKAIVESRREYTEMEANWAYWKKLLLHPNTPALCLMYVGNSYAYYFCITWLPTYLEKQHGMKGAALGIGAGLPLLLSVAGDIFGGLTTDWLCKRFGTRIGRSVLGVCCYSLAAVAMLAAAWATNPWVATWCLSIAVAAVMFTLGAAWGTVIEIGGHHTGMVGAVMNTAGNTAAIFQPLVAIGIQQVLPGGWNAPLYVMSGLIAMGAVAWCFVNPRKHIFQ